MSYNNPFNQSLDWALRGKYARVDSGSKEYERWVEIVHHNRGSVILHDAVNASTGESLGSVYVRVIETAEVVKPKKRVEYRSLDELRPNPDHDGEFTSGTRRMLRGLTPWMKPTTRDTNH